MESTTFFVLSYSSITMTMRGKHNHYRVLSVQWKSQASLSTVVKHYDTYLAYNGCFIVLISEYISILTNFARLEPWMQQEVEHGQHLYPMVTSHVSSLLNMHVISLMTYLPLEGQRGRFYNPALFLLCLKQ